MEGDHERTRSGNLPLRCFLLSVALPSFPPSQEDEESSSVLKDAGNDGDPSLARPLADAEHTHEGANRVLRIPVLEILLPQPNKNPFAAALAAGGQSPSAPCSRTASEPPSVVASSRSCFQLSRSSDASAWARDASPSESGQGSEGEDNAATGEEAHDAGRNVEDELGEEAWETDEDGDETAVMCLAFMDWRDSRGPCFARALCEWLLPTSPLREATAVRKPGETRLELLLQTDSHMRFAPHFDCFLLNQLTLAAALSAETKRARSPSTLSPPSHAFSLSANASPARSSAPPSACSSLLVTEKVVLTGYPPGYEEGLPFFEFPQPPHTSGTTESPSVGACPSDDTRHLPPRPSSQTFSLPCVSSSSSSRSCEREGFATPHAPSASRSRRLCASGLEAASALPAHGGQEPRGQSEEGRSEGTEEERPTGRRNEPGEGGQDLDLAEWTKEKTGQRFPEVYFPGILLCAGHFDRNGLLRTKGRALRFDGSASKAEPRGSGGDSQGATRNRCSYAGSSSASAPPLASASFSAAADPVPSESSGFSLEEGSREGNLSMKMTHLVRPPTACACSCLHCCELEEAPGTCEQERASLAESPASSVSSSALSLSPSFSPSTCLFPLKSLFWAAGFSFAPARVIREVGYDPRLQFVFFGEEQTMTLRLFTHGWSFFAPRFSVVFHLWTRARRPFFKTDLRHLFSEKEKPLGDTCLAVSSSISSSVCSPFSSSVCSSLSSISSSVSSSVCSSVSSRALPPAGSTQKRVEAVETRREITSTAERKRQRREERKAKGEKEECRDGWKATQGRTEAESPSGSESQGPAPATTQEGKEGRSAGTCGELEADRNGEEETKDTRDACKGTRAREAERLPARLGAYVSEDGDWKERKSGNKLQWDQTEGSKEAATAGLETNEAKKTDAWRNADTHETRDRIATTRKGLIGDEQKSSRASYASHSFDLSAVARPPSCSPWGGSRGLPSPASSSASLPPFWAGSLSPASSPSLPRSAFASMLSPGEARVRRILSATASSCPAELRSLGLGSERPPEAFWREIGVNVETRFISKRARDGGYSEDIFQVTAKEHQTQREGVQLLLSLLREHEKETRC
ncbi:[Skp1-protein]-hydroxyproline N-acetylglucosaminyltransferase, related [Neospora caninum Liverpool]|uniref:[Skp1-protein]-hydroxyproline N-acetylglucosaminyltransferase, related n=1 Tax=Neospora caninum (strain Liverpool) TaxID=572307 RepID=F0VNY2_NEOCL|nr:[Skp1-protein]-hydroxyproline N-acetylglucosaminyltransferase, related [Neospora caninum Liverpool]CBZ55428.1 [Skp1-protein]-hydroxyproline N-acetylglucosaminyltransferase, related [Neospora caninum Liverpool]CEL70164.1 TPA: [Skp1-protein]-hydroxyproline N-acetylglucosaminyltransferase, related [Neospora caninum Liverpool]|eukprot:XP_003885456.1 [Skp1-protein]-hydroxyproline N-acetylglucosaminyltransferase, related [Neospora caninum Liverpool]